jgi:alpha-L-rhamnosidase
VFDVSPLLKEGENVIEGVVGEGWYAGRLGFGAGKRNIWGERIGLLAQLEVEGKVVVVTDECWEWSFGPLISSEIYEGEHYDSREQKSWSPVTVIPHPRGQLVYPQSPPVRATQIIDVQEIITTPSGKTVLDFGQNLVGWCRFNVDPRGGEVVLRHAEVLDGGEVGVGRLRVRATDTVVRSGMQMKGWQPKFTFHGFR